MAAKEYGHSSPLAPLWYEVALLERLLYKNKNQHRHTIHFQRLQQVHRLLSIVRKSPQAKGTLEQLVGEKGGTQRTSTLDPCRPQTGAGLQTLLEQLLSAIEAASKALGALLAQSFFMPFALTVFACLARIDSIASQALTALSRRSERAVTGSLVAERGATTLQVPAMQPNPPFASPAHVQKGPVSPKNDIPRTAIIQQFPSPCLETGPLGFPVPVAMAPLAGGSGESITEPPPEKRARFEDVQEASGDRTGTAKRSAEERGAEPLNSIERNLNERLARESPHAYTERGESSPAEKAGRLAGERLEVQVGEKVVRETTPAEKMEPRVNQAAVLDVAKIVSPSQQVSMEVDERKKRAAAWLEDLGFEPSPRETGPSQKGLDSGKVVSSESRKRKKSGGRQQIDVRSKSDLASGLLAGTDFEAFGGFK